MGISGLSSWLEEHGSEHANLRELRRGAEVHIDGNGLAWHLLLAQSKASPAIRLAAYEEFGFAVDNALSSLVRKT